MGEQLERCVDILRSAFLVKRSDNPVYRQFWTQTIQSCPDPQEDTTLASALQRLTQNTDAACDAATERELVVEASRSPTLRPVALVYGAICALLLRAETAEKGDPAVSVAVAILIEYLTVSKWSHAIEMKHRNALSERVKRLAAAHHISLPPTFSETSAPCVVGSAAAASAQDMIQVDFPCSEVWPPITKGRLEETTLQNDPTANSQEQSQTLQNSSNQPADFTDAAVPALTLPALHGHRVAQSLCDGTSSDSADDQVGYPVDPADLEQLEEELFGHPFWETSNILPQKETSRSINVVSRSHYEQAVRKQDGPTFTRFRPPSLDDPMDSEPRKETENILHHTAEVMLQTAHRYGVVLQHDKETLAEATLAAVDYLSQTFGAMAAARLLSWGNKLSFLQEMVMLAAAVAVFTFMFFFIFATIMIA